MLYFTSSRRIQWYVRGGRSHTVRGKVKADKVTAGKVTAGKVTAGKVTADKSRNSLRERCL
jgi:hypothetical protein